MKKYADIIIDISHEAIDRAFQYEVPDLLRKDIDIGVEVMVPFGLGNTMRKGYVIGFSEVPNYPEERIKAIDSICEKSIAVEANLISLAAWLRKQYGGTMIQALKTVLPVREKTKQLISKTIVLQLQQEQAMEQLAVYERKHSVARYRLLKELIEEQSIPFELVRDKLHISSQTLKGMENEGVIQVLSDTTYRKIAVFQDEKSAILDLNEEQLAAVQEIQEESQKEKKRPCLIHGVTGSGKTEVYIELIAQTVAEKKQAIVLIPEIGLTYQTVKRFRRRFGDRVTILNSKMSKGERYDQFLRMKNGEADIVIGPRSALFAPFSNLGIIIVDEEHDTSYKSDSQPCYHAREVAVEIAKRQDALVVLGSATPSVISYTKAKLSEYRLVTLKNRAVPDSSLPAVTLVDLREELKNGNRSVFSDTLKRKMQETIARGEQVMLFMNRRGYESFISCRSCGETMKCPHCDVSLTLHGKQRLVCHYCGFERTFMGKCTSCGSHMIAGFQMGTEKLEAEVKRQFPDVRTLRMDLDTVRKKDSHETILEKFEQHEADVLVGTQMIIKGHDFANVTLMGIVLADLSLHDSDYLASEKTFDLLTQAAGRAGRGDKAGEVVIQTYRPEHYSIVSAMHQDYEMFYEQEIMYREMLKYPPVYHMLVIAVTSDNEKYADALIQNVTDYVKREYADVKGLLVIGPSEAMIAKISDIHRRVVYCKHISYNTLVNIKGNMEAVLEQKGLPQKTHIQFDFNPMKVW